MTVIQQDSSAFSSTNSSVLASMDRKKFSAAEESPNSFYSKYALIVTKSPNVAKLALIGPGIPAWKICWHVAEAAANLVAILIGTCWVISLQLFPSLARHLSVCQLPPARHTGRRQPVVNHQAQIMVLHRIPEMFHQPPPAVAKRRRNSVAPKPSRLINFSKILVPLM